MVVMMIEKVSDYNTNTAQEDISTIVPSLSPWTSFGWFSTIITSCMVSKRFLRKTSQMKFAVLFLNDSQ